MGTGELDIIVTGDGSNTLYFQKLDETYHSRHGAIQESRHVFIENGLKYIFESAKFKKISILEVGFGTGLNALLTEEFCKIHADREFEMTSLEPFPLPDEIIRNLNYAQLAVLDKKIWDAMHQAPWGAPFQLLPNFMLKKVKITLQKFESFDPFDLVYFDAFAPNKQPEIWSEEVLRNVYNMMQKRAVFVTYCAQGQFKRTLKAIGFRIESLAGPPGKKEMVRAVKI